MTEERKLNVVELHNLFSSFNSILVIKWRREERDMQHI